jgi:hypothetical protein
MRIVFDLASLSPGTAYWVPAVEAPARDWAAAPGCRRGARYLIAADTLGPGHSGFPAFDSRAECLRWIMLNRQAIGEQAPDALPHAARLDAWMLGLDAL